MKKVSIKLSPKLLPKYEKLLLDCDVNPFVEVYLRKVGFRVLFATRVKVDIHDDVAIIKWARQHGYIVVAHDRYKDRRTKIRVYPDVYHNGGRVIQVAGGPDQNPLTSVGRILFYREDWMIFFRENDGLVLLAKDQPMKKMPRAYLLRNILKTDLSPQIISTIPLKSTQRKSRTGRKPIPKPLEQFHLLPP